MKWIKFLLAALITGALAYFLTNPQNIKGTGIPPLGYLLDPLQGFWENQRDLLPTDPQIPGLKGEVTIHFDSMMIPHIYAENMEDLFRAQGYVVAMLRLWQMEFQTHAAAGRISEIIGADALDFDRGQRRKGMVLGAEATLGLFKKDPELWKALEAYSEGVNAYISSLTYATLPFEYKLLGYHPEPWTSFKTALLLQYMSDNLTGFDQDIEYTWMLKKLGKEKFDLLFPERIPGIDPTVPSDGPWDFEAEEIPIPEDIAADPMVITKLLEKSNPKNGSNNWAVSGTKTASGKPILANDTHLGLNLPSLWIMMELQYPGYHVYGFTFTGSPGIVIGFNEKTAWGFTNAPRDMRDWYKIRFKDDKQDSYWYDSTWRPVTHRIDTFKIKGQEAFVDTILITHHGPVVYDARFGVDNPKQGMALRWTAHEPSRIFKAYLNFNKGKGLKDYFEAIPFWETPPQNVVFASTEGDLALTVAGKFIHRWEGQGKFVLDGSRPDHEWQGYISPEHHARQVNPERGFVSSANQHSVDAEYPYWFFNSNSEYYRNRRINRRLTQMEGITPKDFMKLHLDNYSIQAEEALPMLLDSIKGITMNEKEREVYRSLTQWDYYYEADLKAPMYFNLWWRNIYKAVWDWLEDDDNPVAYPNTATTVHLIKTRPLTEFSPGKASMTQLFESAFREMVSEASDDQNWGQFKGTALTHLSRQEALSITNIHMGGSSNAINAQSKGHGPSQRMVVHLTEPPEAWVVYPGGQSGNPGSPFYSNLLPMYQDGTYLNVKLKTRENFNPEDIFLTFTLTPKP